MHQLGPQVQSLCGGWSAHKFGELKCISLEKPIHELSQNQHYFSILNSKIDILLRAKNNTNLGIYDVTITSKLPHRIYTPEAAELAGSSLHAFKLTLVSSLWKMFAQAPRI